MLVMHRAMGWLQVRRVSTGLELWAERGTSTSTGAGFLCGELGRRGLIALVLSQSPGT
jgi:hypothetical protein